MTTTYAPGDTISNVYATVSTLKETAYNSTLLIAKLDDGTVIKTFEKYTPRAKSSVEAVGPAWLSWGPRNRVFITSATVKKLETFRGTQQVVLSEVKIDALKSDRVVTGGMSVGGSGIRTYSDGTNEPTYYQLPGENDAEFAARKANPGLHTAASAAAADFAFASLKSDLDTSTTRVDIDKDGNVI